MDLATSADSNRPVAFDPEDKARAGANFLQVAAK
jgi:hypothetical protein